MVVGARKRIVACTAEAAEHLHRDAAQVAERAIEFVARAAGQTDSGHRQERQGDFEPRNSPGPRRTALRASILPVKTRERSEMVVVLNSLTSAPVFEQNLRRLDRLASLGTLSASMAHEIKNGMVAIKTFVDLLAQKGQDTELTEVVGRELAAHQRDCDADAAVCRAEPRGVHHRARPRRARPFAAPDAAPDQRKIDFAAAPLPGRAGHRARRRRAIAAGVHESAAQRA